MPTSPVADLIQRSAAANAALMRGDVDGYRALVPLTSDFTLMSPFGGAPTHGADMTGERWEAMGRFFRNGTLEQEVVQTYASADMIVLAVIERACVEVGGLPAQEWPLRGRRQPRAGGGARARRGSMTALPAAALGRTSLGVTTAVGPD